MKKIILITSFLLSTFAFGQVGINTENPQGILNVDGGNDNPSTGTPTTTQQANDFVVTKDGSVGIGTTTPDVYAKLHVLSNDDQGILIPSVDLTSNTMDLDSDGDSDITNQPSGLLIYNKGNILSAGYYFWNGTEWRTIDNSTAITPSITSLLCGAASLSPASYTINEAYVGNLTVPYTGGNGGSYATGATVTVNGLNITLRSGKLEYGSGELIFSVEGTSTISSPTATTVALEGSNGNNLIPFLTSALACDATFGDQSGAEVKVSATLGPLYTTTDPSAGYHRYVTTPDGKFSVRVVINQGGTYGGADAQIRSNDGTPTIMWNGHVAFVSGTFVYGNNGMTFPTEGDWYGNGNGSGTTMGSEITNAWGNEDVYYGSPEYRRYTWTTTDSTDPTMYTVTFMMGAPQSGTAANSISCPGGTCTETKVFIKIEQTKGQ
ncbi:MAG: hypothetical protein ACK5IC_07770 [Moheibacter sp.]